MDAETKNAIQKLNEATFKSKCSMCGSEAYGKGCIYNARGIHLHMDDQTRCGWCGSKTIYGRGCIYSPTGYHGVGANLYTSMVAEGFITSYILKLLKTPFTETKAFESGIINENGVVVKKPKTEQEKNSFTILDSLLFKIKKYLGSKIDLISESMYFEASKKLLEENTSVEEFQKELEFKRKFSTIHKNFTATIEEARSSNLSTATIEKIILEEFSK